MRRYTMTNVAGVFFVRVDQIAEDRDARIMRAMMRPREQHRHDDPWIRAEAIAWRDYWALGYYKLRD